jgi:hypothetical protein
MDERVTASELADAQLDLSPENAHLHKEYRRPVAVFDGTILATAALAAPDIMAKLAGAALDTFGDLPEEERDILFETFRCGRKPTRRWAPPPNGFVVTPTPCATDCAEWRSGPDDLSRAHGTSQNYVWRSRFTAGSSERDSLSHTSVIPVASRQV